MGSRSEALAARVEDASNQLLEVVENSNDAQWSAPSANAPWTQGFVSYHAGSSIGNISEMIRGMASGAPMPPITLEQIDGMNAEFHAAHKDCTRAETVEAIKTGAPAAVAMVRGLGDAELDRKVTLAAGMPEMSVEQVVEMLLIGHTVDHTASITAVR